jgi:hypothetical protein
MNRNKIWAGLPMILCLSVFLASVFLSALGSVFGKGVFVFAGTLDSPGDVTCDTTSRLYSIENVYDYLTDVDSAPPSKSTGGFQEPSTGPAGTMHTLDDVFENLQRLPATGQTTSYGTGPDDADYLSGATKRYGDYAHSDTFPDGTAIPQYVTYDYNTGLMWVRDGNESDGCNGGSTITWEDAKSHCESCTLASYDDWRLPNVYELIMICKLENSIGAPYIDTTYFPSTAGAYYWGSSTHTTIVGQALGVDFAYGVVSGAVKTSSYRVRCVRGGQ